MTYFLPGHGLPGNTFGGNHLACAAALAVPEVMETESLPAKAIETGAWLREQLCAIPQLENVRGKGLMIGFDLPDHLKTLRSLLLKLYRIFTGEAKPNVVRLLPAPDIDKEASKAPPSITYKVWQTCLPSQNILKKRANQKTFLPVHPM